MKDNSSKPKSSVMGKICLCMLIAILLCIAAMWTCVICNPGHRAYIEETQFITNWAMPSLFFLAKVGMVTVPLALVIPLIILLRRKYIYSRKDCIIAAWTLLLSLILGLHCLAIPTFFCYRTDTRTGLCNNNKRLIDHAKGVIQIKKKLKDGDVVSQSDAVAFIHGGWPSCLDKGIYTINPIGQRSTCSEHGH